MSIVGSGDFKYELLDSWPKMPKYWEFTIASDVYVNSKDEIHVFSRGLHPLTIWDKDGNFISDNDSIDSFGHSLLGGVSVKLSNLIFYKY